MKKLVLGIGNILLKDEGVGCHVARALEKICQPDIDVVDGGTSPEVVSLVRGVDKVVIVDAVKGGGRPGEVYKFRPGDIIGKHKVPCSSHDLNVVETLMWMRWCGSIDDVVIVGIEPKETSWGLELSPELEEKIPRITEIVLAELNKGEERC